MNGWTQKIILPNVGGPLPTKFPLVKTMAFPVTMYGCESWTIDTTEHSKMEKLYTVRKNKTGS